ncbi:E3 ubiquitin-protein ligase TRIM33-like [Ruditapes philippinarum]|uniref:E3 ubiquitin-protein ligase TRIM33-like n=1 Tax=Ruditapes philippinarum TaxID=129788 RepID=UPI00295AF8EC|nr:E3 ubiquitin-protein ligase TRIM33-like [Ruditapes philippinarum]
MEVSGKVALTSKTNLNLYCNPCDTDGLKKLAHGFCQDCNEHLCKNCFQHHRRSRPSRKHVLLNKYDMALHQTTVDVNADIITDNCSNHKDKLLEFYCNNHKTVSCKVCVTHEHKRCIVDFIPEGLGNVSSELINFNKKMEVLVKKCENNIIKAVAASKRLDQSKRKVNEDISLFRKEINAYLDQMESMMIKETEAIINAANYKLENIKAACEKLAEEVKRSQSFLNDLNKTNEQNKLFIEMKNVGPRLMTLESEEIQIVKDIMAYDDIQFDRNQKLLDQLKNKKNFGTILTYGKPLADTEICMRYKRSLNVKFPSDENQSDVFGAVTISATHMILADYGNKKIKTVNIATGTQVSEETLSSAPFDVIRLPQINLLLHYLKKNVSRSCLIQIQVCLQIVV